MSTFGICEHRGSMHPTLKLLAPLAVAFSALVAQAQGLPANPRLERVDSGLLPPLIAANTQPMRLADRMRHHGVPGLSVAVVDKGQLVWAQAWGVKQAGQPAPLTTDTQMQAACSATARV